MSDVTLTPTENYTLANVNDPERLFDYYPDGNMAGNTNAGEFSILNRFTLPAATPGSNVTRAIYVLRSSTGAATDEASSADDTSDFRLGVYVVANTPSVPDMTIQTRPVAKGTPLASFHPQQDAELHLDITAAVNAAYHGDGVISLLVGTTDPRYVMGAFPTDKSLIITIA